MMELIFDTNTRMAQKPKKKPPPAPRKGGATKLFLLIQKFKIKV